MLRIHFQHLYNCVTYGFQYTMKSSWTIGHIAVAVLYSLSLSNKYCVLSVSPYTPSTHSAICTKMCTYIKTTGTSYIASTCLMVERREEETESSNYWIQSLHSYDFIFIYYCHSHGLLPRKTSHSAHFICHTCYNYKLYSKICIPVFFNHLHTHTVNITAHYAAHHYLCPLIYAPSYNILI